MKKSILFIATALIVIFFLGGFAPLYAQEKAEVTGTITNAQLTPEKMNCKTGMYKTYQDFVNNNPKPWKWVNFDIGSSMSGFTRFLVIFKDENGKKIKMDPNEFWGFRDDNRELYRNGSFVNGSVTAIPFFVKYVATDYIMYHPEFLSNATVSPHEWCSTDLNSPIMKQDDFLKKHGKVVYDRIEKETADCKKHINKAFTTKYGAHETECLQRASDVICSWTTSGAVKGSYVK